MKRLFSILLASCISLAIFAQNNENSDSLKTQRELFPQEKVYVMTDRELYATGDTIWFRGWIVDGETLTEKQLSRYLYVELRDPAGNLQQRVRVLLNKDNVYEGYLPLDINLPSNGYTLVAYTYYMAGTNEKYFFKKQLDVLSPTDILNGITSKSLLERTYPKDYKEVISGESASCEFNVPANGNYAVSVSNFSLSPSNQDIISHSLQNQKGLFSMEFIRQNKGYIIPTYPYEQGNVISGTIYSNISNKKTLKNVKVTAVALQDSIFIAEYITDENGHFTIPIFDTKENTTFIVQAQKGNSSKTNISFDTLNLPNKVTALPVLPNHFAKSSSTASDDINSKLWAQELKNSQSILLNEIVVKEKKLDEPEYDFHPQTTRTKIFTDEESYRLNSYNAILSSFGITRRGDYYKYHGIHYVSILFDGIPIGSVNDKDYNIDEEVLNSYCPPMMLKAVELFNPLESMGIPGNAGKTSWMINFITRKGKDAQFLSDRYTNCRYYTQMGTQSHKNFIYNSAAKEYSAPIIYWNPSAKANNEGILKFEVPIPQQTSATYRVTVEGIGPNGELVHEEKYIRCK